MNKKITLSLVAVFLIATASLIIFNKGKSTSEINQKTELDEEEKSLEEKMMNAKERELHELAFQINPLTGEIPQEEKNQEFSEAFIQLSNQSKTSFSNVYISRGPSNLGGRTRGLVIDKSDATGNTIIAGGVSSGVFRTINGGVSWIKVSNNSEIHNCTTIAQDPRPGFQNIWYYGTGEWFGNSASLGSLYSGQGVWKSTNGGLNWSVIPGTSSEFTSFDSFFDYVNHIEVSPTNGHVLIATTGRIYRYDGTNMKVELELGGGTTGWTDVKIAANGRVYAALEGTSAQSGVYTSPTGIGNWTKLNNPTPSGYSPAGRVVLATAPSNSNIVYVLYNNGKSTGIEADLWRFDLNSTSWTNFSSKLPDEPNGDSVGNDPFAIQSGYDLVVAVKPNDENSVYIGGTNAYEILDITSQTMFSRIGGYRNNQNYALYDIGGTQHHPDIHAFAFSHVNPDILFSGTDGGVHRTSLTGVSQRSWVNLNNDYVTYQYYHVALEPFQGSDIVIGGAQDNGTTMGGTNAGFTNKTLMTQISTGDGVAVAIGARFAQNSPTMFWGFQNGRIFRRTTGSTEITPSGSSSQFVTYFYLDPDNTNVLFYAGNSNLYKTKNAASVTISTWENFGPLLTNERIRSMATTRGTYDANNSYLFIGGDKGGLFRIKDYQNAVDYSNISNITPPQATTNSGTIVSGIATHPTNKDIVLVTYANYGILNIFLTTNATAETPTWTVVERNLNAHSIRSAAIAEVNGQTIYFVGSARGLYSSTDPTSVNWQLEGSNTIGLAVVSSLVYRPSDATLLVGTHGNGMFETKVTSTLSTNTFANNSLNLEVFPNPTTNYINVKSKYLVNNSTYKIFDIRGSLVDKGKVSNSKVDVQNLKSGVYFLQVFADKRNQSIKIVKK